ncbi:MAG: MmgE/PrpD family protein [Spirochaetota bacterium]
MDHTIKLARFCSDVSFDSLPGEVIHKAKLCVLDYIANIYGSLELDAVKAVVEYVESLGGPKAGRPRSAAGSGRACRTRPS